MRSIGGFLSSRVQPHGSSQSLNAIDEAHQIEDAMRAAALIMSDDVEGAEAALSKGNSPFHKMGKGVVVFIRATLGFEPEVMREASEALGEAENSAYDHHRQATRRDGSHKSSIYAPGTEYALCLAQAQLMSAVVGVLHESLTESIKGFYKLRKAYITLDGILASENTYVRRQTSSVSKEGSQASSTTSVKTLEAPNISVAGSSLPVSPARSDASGLEGERSDVIVDGAADDESDEEDEFYDADESSADVPVANEYQGHVVVEPPEDDDTRPSSSRTDVGQEKPFYQLQRSFTSLTLKDGPDKDLFSHDPIDLFIHSGSNLCFGILQLLISLIPPTFGSLLKIVGFRSDRERGINMLWQATKFHNIYGGIAGIVLFGFYNLQIAFCDILPSSGEGSYPKERCILLLKEMVQRYPNSQLWKLEEARMLANEKQLEKSVAVMNDSQTSQLKQLEALRWFERSLNCMYMHDYEECSRSFQKCIELNNWSHGLYYYIMACCHLELYRLNEHKDPDEARRQSKKATDLFLTVPKHAGRKRFMARQLPFDAFIVRKLAKWQARAAAHSIPLVAAVGVSPIEEIIYFWNGYRRMRPEHLQVSLDNLERSSTAAAHDAPWITEDADERGVLALLRAATMRYQKRFAEARVVIQTEILQVDKALFKGALRDNWAPPCGRYELAANLYVEMQERGGELDRETVLEISNLLDEVARWESYDLDARMGIRITTAKDTVKRLGVKSTA